jgi:inorganic pyrophosphatase
MKKLDAKESKEQLL